MDKGEVLRRLECLRVRTRNLDVIELCDVLGAVVARPALTASGKRLGRPPSGKALSNAERQRRYRARQARGRSS